MFNKRSGKAFSKHYTPPATKQYEAVVRQATALMHPLPEPFTADLYVIINLRFPDRMHGDIDNLVKSILDGMQGVAFKNDRQIKRVDTEIFFEDNQAGFIETIIMRHRPRGWSERLDLETLELLAMGIPF